MASINVGDLVELRYGSAWLGSVYTPRKLCINPVLENEECLALAPTDERTVESARRAA
jgi:hypothetical protein